MGTSLPIITRESIETLLSILSSSMLVIATFAVASMVSAYASASRTATPRSFSLIIADDVSQNALSTFIGAFIFSIVALVVVKNAYYEQAGLLILFLLTIGAFALVIGTFVLWVDRIARLGRLGATIDKVESATKRALRDRKMAPRLGGVELQSSTDESTPIFATSVGYVQRIDMDALQRYAKKHELRIVIAALPGALASPGAPLAYLISDSRQKESDALVHIEKAFVIGDDRLFDEDPRFGLIVLSEIASRALSPAVNDPGTAIDIICTYLRLFTYSCEPLQKDQEEKVTFDRIEVPEIFLDDMFDDAFTAIARDGAGLIEVSIRLQKALSSLACLDSAAMKSAAKRHTRIALERAKKKMDLSQDLEMVQGLSDALCTPSHRERGRSRSGLSSAG